MTVLTLPHTIQRLQVIRKFSHPHLQPYIIHLFSYTASTDQLSLPLSNLGLHISYISDDPNWELS